MKLVYISLTGNVRSFIEKIGMDSQELSYSNPQVEMQEDYIVIVPTYDDEITDVTSQFIDYKNNKDKLIGFVGSGNKNWDEFYCFNAKDLSKKYSKPMIMDFELDGTNQDVIRFKKEVENIAIT